MYHTYGVQYLSYITFLGIIVTLQDVTKKITQKDQYMNSSLKLDLFSIICPIKVPILGHLSV